MAWAPSQHGRSTQDSTPVLQGSERGGKLGGRIWDLGGRPMHRHSNLPAPLSCTNWCSPVARSHRRSQISLHHPDSSRQACRSRSGPLRAGTPPSHHDRGVGIPSVLALIGARDTVLGLRQFRGQNKCACAVVGLLAISLSPQQPFSSSPILGVVCLWVSTMPCKRKKCTA